MVSVKSGYRNVFAFLFAGFYCIAPQVFTADHRNLLKSADCLSKLAVGTLGENSGKKLYTNQRKFDFGANFAVFKIPL